MVSIDDKKINPSKKIIDDIKIQIIYIPLETKNGIEYKSNVKVGDYVYIGSTVATSNKCDIELKSTVSGTVVGFETKYISSGKLTNTIVIENDFK